MYFFGLFDARAAFHPTADVDGGWTHAGHGLRHISGIEAPRQNKWPGARLGDDIPSKVWPVPPNWPFATASTRNHVQQGIVTSHPPGEGIPAGSAFRYGTPHCSQNSGVSSPCHWSKLTGTLSNTAFTSASEGATNSAVTVMKGGSSAHIAAARSRDTALLLLGQNTRPTASAPASAATTASASLVIPHILTCKDTRRPDAEKPRSLTDLGLLNRALGKKHGSPAPREAGNVPGN